jgi:hypothetical protein
VKLKGSTNGVLRRSSMPLDSYFTSKSVHASPSEKVLVRWKALKRLPHDLLAAEMDELYRRQRLGTMSDEELGLIHLWEATRHPF